MPALPVIQLQQLQLDESDSEFFQNLIFEVSGISMSAKKSDLIATRLRPHIISLGYGSFAEYRDVLANAPRNSRQVQEFINLLTTNKTEFFRERAHFDHMVASVLPVITKNGSNKRKVQVWCAASSTGEEAYTLAMVLKHSLPSNQQLEILATDIDTEVLELAANGVYPANRLAEIPSHYHHSCVKLGSGRASGWFKISDDIHRAITFRQHNLNDPAPPAGHSFDIIFCRNVLIYFSTATIQTLSSKLHRLLKVPGFLFVGHSESLPPNQLFSVVKPSLFRKI